jgi:hypothetical protein
MVGFYCNRSIHEGSHHSPFKESYGFQPATPTDKVLPLIGAPSHDVDDRLTDIANAFVTLCENF